MLIAEVRKYGRRSLIDIVATTIDKLPEGNHFASHFKTQKRFLTQPSGLPSRWRVRPERYVLEQMRGVAVIANRQLKLNEALERSGLLSRRGQAPLSRHLVH